MSVRRIDPVQPESFKFSPANMKWAKETIAKYPKGKEASAVIPLLWRAQEQHGGWLPEPAMRAVAEILDMAYIRVYEVATFYTMFNLSPVGEHFVQLCGTTPCWLRGANELKDVCRRVIGEQNTVTQDGKLSWLEVECLGACTNAPMVQINKDYYEDLTPETFERILKDLRDGKTVQPGPQNGRQFSAPEGGPTTLLNRAQKKKKASSGSAKSNDKAAATAGSRRTRKTPAAKGSVDVKIRKGKSINGQKLEEERKARPPLDYPDQKKMGAPGYGEKVVGGETDAWGPDKKDSGKKTRAKTRKKGRK